jgi:uncharacterized protein (TIGR02285 family)
MSRRLTTAFAVCLAPALALSGTAPARAGDPTEILWVHPYVKEGVYDPANRRDALEDNVLNYFMDHLRGYRQSVTTTTPARLMALFKSNDGVCYPMLKKTPEREATIRFSSRLFWVLPERLVVLDRNAARFEPYLDAAGAVSLPALLDDATLSGPLQEGRAFSPAVNRALADHAGRAALRPVPKEVDAVAMLAGGHLDWLIAYPVDLTRIMETTFPDARYRSYPIAGSDLPVEAFVGCSRKPDGIRVIADIDALIAERHGLQDFYDRWITPDERAALHRFIDAGGG